MVYAGRAAFRVFLAAAVLLVSGCARSHEATIPIKPLAPAAGRVDPGLGPATRALSFGPGYKGSPSWSPRGDRIAFTVDGYVVDKPTGSGDLRRWTTKDFVAEDAEWASEDSLTILGAAPGAGNPSAAASRSVYLARPRGESFGLEKIATQVLATTPLKGGSLGGSVLAIETSPRESGLALTHADGDVYRVYTNAVEGRITAVSPSPDAKKVVLAVRPPGDGETSELRVFDLRRGTQKEITRLDGNREILGNPQWTRHGLYFVAGKEGASDSDGAEPLYDLDRAPAEGGAPKPAPGVGEDFVAASVRVSPDGERLAVIGRLNPKSPSNLYVLDLKSEDLRAVTTNEDMEIKTGPDDLAWSPDGESVVIVARGTPSTEPEVHAAAAGNLLRDFYNLYEVPVGGSKAG